MLAWQAPHFFKGFGGFGSCERWQETHGFDGLWDSETTCGKPVGRVGRYSWQSRQSVLVLVTAGLIFSGSSLCAEAGP